MEYLQKPTHGSIEWLTLRHKHNGLTIVGASEVSIVMGVNKYKNIIDLAIEKLQPPQLREQNHAMKRGTFLEQGLLDYASNELGITIVTPDTMYLNNRIISTLDGLAGHQIFEAKTTTAWLQNDPIIPEWYWQAHAQMFCTDSDAVTFIVLDRNLTISMFDVYRNDDDIALMCEKVEAFCASIDAGELPDDTPLTAEQVTRLHPEPAGEIELGATGLELVQRLAAIRESIRYDKQEEKELADALANYLRDNQIGSIDGQPIITYKAQTRTAFDVARFTEEHPDLANQYTKKTTFRTLRTVKGTI